MEPMYYNEHLETGMGESDPNVGRNEECMQYLKIN